MELSDYYIYQKGYNDTALNVAYTGSVDYDTTLVSPLEESDVDGTQIVLKFLTHVVTASGTMPLKTYDPVTNTVCDLEDVNTLECT
jgi:uncharacterized protein (AIM24 family)